MVRESLRDLIESLGYDVATFESAERFLKATYLAEHRDKVLRRDEIGFAVSLTNVGARSAEEFINCGVPFIRVSWLDGPGRHHARRQPLTLINVENRVFAQH